MRVHQASIARLAERRECDRPLRPLRGLGRLARTEARIGERAERTAAYIGELAALLLDPRSVFSGQEGLSRQGLGERTGCLRPLEIACRERFLRLARCGGGHQHVHPGPLGQDEPIAAERRCQGVCAVDAVLRECAAQLAGDHGERFLPRRGRCLTPQGLGELVARDRPALLGHEVGEQQPALSPVEPLLVDHHAVGLDGYPTCEEDPQLEPPSRSLPAFCLDLVLPS